MRDDQDGAIEADDWREQRPRLLAERDAAEAEVSRFRARAEEIAAQISDVDADGETLRRPADLRRTVAVPANNRSGSGVPL